jgi:peptide-methionine (S)-S-oxide reductase
MESHSRKVLVLISVLALSPAACGPARGNGEAASSPAAPGADAATLERATFAGGCFWCMEAPFDELSGVVATTSGYIGGRVEDPTYEEVSAGGTGHAEAVEVRYDPERVSYEELLRVFWRNVDPADAEGQFCDRGSQYRTGIFYHSASQRRLAEASKRELEGRFDRALVTPIEPAGTFYPAEEYHQDFYQENPIRYRVYRAGCGRDRRLQQLWGGEAGGH